MTKAEIVNKISKETGVEKAVVFSVVEEFMEQVRHSDRGRERLFEGIRYVFAETSCGQDSPQHFQKYDDRRARP